MRAARWTSAAVRQISNQDLAFGLTRRVQIVTGEEVEVRLNGARGQGRAVESNGFCGRPLKLWSTGI